MTEALPPFAAPHVADFEAIARRLRDIDDFTLQPVQSTSPALGHVFADWLTGQGYQVERHDLGAEGIGGLLSFLVRERVAGGRRAYVVIAPPHLPETMELRNALAGVNFSRDGIARTLAAPLLWWGDVEFMRVTRGVAPDFWSIAGGTVWLDAPGPGGVSFGGLSGAVWRTDASCQPRAELERDFTAATEPGARAHAGLRLVEGLLAEQELAAARRLHASLRAEVRERAPGLGLRWEALRAALVAPRGSVSELRAELARLRDAGELHVMAAFHLNVVDRMEEDRAQTRERWLAAFGLLREAGDAEAATTAIFERFVVLGEGLAATERERLRVGLKAIAESTEERRTLARAAWVQAALALQEDDLGGAEQDLGAAERGTEDDPLLALEVLGLRAALALRWGRGAEALAAAEAYRGGAVAADLPARVRRAEQLCDRARELPGGPATS